MSDDLTARNEMLAVLATVSITSTRFLAADGVPSTLIHSEEKAAQVAVDALLAAGYVKLPSREEILATLSDDDVLVRYAMSYDWFINSELAADALLAMLTKITHHK